MKGFKEKIKDLTHNIQAQGINASLKIQCYNHLFKIKVFIDDWRIEDCSQQIFAFLKQHADEIYSLELSAADHGANGTKTWDLSELIEGKHFFTHLKIFHIEKNSPDFHNKIIVTNKDDYEENGVLGTLLTKAPNLRELSAPSAPNGSFFTRDYHPLENLEIQAGYDTHHFILLLAQSKCFKNLRKLSFQDYSETYVEEYQKECTPFEEYFALFHSEELPNIQEIMLINTLLSDAEKKELAQSPLAKKLKKLEFKSLL